MGQVMPPPQIQIPLPRGMPRERSDPRRSDPRRSPSPLPDQMIRTFNRTFKGSLEVDLPFTVNLNEPFKLDVWLDPKDPKTLSSEEAEIYMEQTDRVSYEPRVFKLHPGERKTI